MSMYTFTEKLTVDGSYGQSGYIFISQNTNDTP